MTASRPTVAAVIVTHNSEEVLAACVGHILLNAPSAGIVVVDNASGDQTVAVAKAVAQQNPGKIEILANGKNAGFAAAVNQGFRATEAALVLVMNPDVQLITPLDHLTNSCLISGLAAGTLVGQDDGIQVGFTVRRFPTPVALALELLGMNRLWPGNPSNRRYRYLDRDWTGATANEGNVPRSPEQEVEQPAGALLMIRRDVWRQLQGFDESFWPIWFEDVDFCKRAVEAGYGIRLVSSVRARHSGGHSIQKIDGASRELYWYDSLLRYAAKHFTPGGYRAVCVAAVGSVIPRMVFNVLRTASLAPVASGFRILKLSGKRLVSAQQHQISRL